MEVYLFHFNTCQDLTLLELGRQQCTPMYSFGPYMRNEYIFHYIVSGKGCLMRNPENMDAPSLSERTEVHAGEGFLLEPHTKHMYIADEEDPWQYIWVVFTGACVPSYLHSAGLSHRNPIYHPEREGAVSQIAGPLLQILERPKASKAFVLGQLHLFFDGLMENAASRIVPAAAEINIENIYIAEATRYIESRYQVIRSLDEIAAYCNITRSHLSRLFKNTFGISLQEYLILYRLRKAKELLMETNLPIREVAEQAGYENVLNFHKAFKNQQHMSPKQWRVRNRSGLEEKKEQKK